MAVPKTSAALRKHLAEYREDLLTRVRKVPCPICGAKPNRHCRNNKGREGNWCHALRHNEAKRQGYVQGRWFAPSV